ncbi:hypothetical protein ABZ863_13205 [Saccharomonospora sp. NPDC046836]
MAAQLVGKTFAADLGQLQVRLTYESDMRMTFVVTRSTSRIWPTPRCTRP